MRRRYLCLVCVSFPHSEVKAWGVAKLAPERPCGSHSINFDRVD